MVRGCTVTLALNPQPRTPNPNPGAARVLDPVFMHLADPKWLVRGQFLRNYYVAGW